MATTVNHWREQTIQEAKLLDDAGLKEAIASLQYQVHQVLSEITDDEANTPFYEYMLSDIEGTIEVYSDELARRLNG